MYNSYISYFAIVAKLLQKIATLLIFATMFNFIYLNLERILCMLQMHKTLPIVDPSLNHPLYKPKLTNFPLYC